MSPPPLFGRSLRLCAWVCIDNKIIALQKLQNKANGNCHVRADCRRVDHHHHGPWMVVF